MRMNNAALILFGLAAAPAAQAAGVARSENFIVMAPDQVLADQVLVRAEDYRRQAAKEWLGQELPPGVGRAIIHVVVCEAEDTGLTWPIDSPQRKFHRLFLRASRERLLGSGLGHEITHLVFAVRYPGRLPVWADEGAASLSDDQSRTDIRRDVIQRYVRTGNWPDLRPILEARTIGASDRATYSVARSLTEYLLSRGDRATFLRFAVAGKEGGWDRALREHYAIHTVPELQLAWQAWASGDLRTGAPATSDRAERSLTNARR